MDRRTLLKGLAGAGSLAATGGLSMPALSQGAAARTLRFVPQANLANFDPVWGTQYVVRNAAALVWDTLYGIDATLQPQRQMVESEEVSDDGLIWTFRLRPGLKFHDGEPVLSKDVVASLARWSARDPMGLMLKAIQNELTAVDDKTVFEKFADYMPRQEKASWLAGGKQMLVDRIEWVVIPDAATAAAALQNGEVDWWESPIPDLVPTLRKNSNIRVDIADLLGNIGSFRMNHLHPPFNDVKARRAVLTALSQEDYMRALVGDDTSH